MEQKNYYAIIPASVRYDKNVSPAAKLLYGEITALCNHKGFCWANNQYFMELYNVGKNSIIRWINELLDGGHILRYFQYDEDGKTIIQRCLSLPNDTTPSIKNDTHSYQKYDGGSPKNDTTPSIKNDTHNITVFNTTLNTTDEYTPQPPKGERGVLVSLLNQSILSDGVKATLTGWLEYKKFKYQESGFSKLLVIVSKKIEQHGEQAVCGLIDECMSNMWKGIIWDKLKTPQRAGLM